MRGKKIKYTVLWYLMQWTRQSSAEFYNAKSLGNKYTTVGANNKYAKGHAYHPVNEVPILNANIPMFGIYGDNMTNIHSDYSSFHKCHFIY